MFVCASRCVECAGVEEREEEEVMGCKSDEDRKDGANVTCADGGESVRMADGREDGGVLCNCLLFGDEDSIGCVMCFEESGGVDGSARNE